MCTRKKWSLILCLNPTYLTPFYSRTWPGELPASWWRESWRFWEAWGSHMDFHSGQQRTKKAKETAPILWGNLKCFQILGTSGLETAVMGTKGSQSPGVLASVYTDWQTYIQGSWMGASLPARPCICILWTGMWGSMWMCSRARLI